MSLSASAAHNALIAFNRFGLGAKPGGPGRIGADAKAAVTAEINTPDIARITDASLPTYAAACVAAQTDFDAAEAVRTQEINARIDKQRSVEVGFVERLVVFWANHFSMTVNKNETVRGTLGQWERDVVRANVLGKFVDMLRGTMTHPAMISYLDNEDSIGPNSPVGLNEGVGLNENLGRELMELHTIGSGGGYTETDVTQMAKIITGWSYVRGWEADGHYNGGNNANRGQFIYRKTWHEPGAIKLMGKTYGGVLGQQQGLNVLNDLAASPATAEHIAFKLIRHFITDEPAQPMVDSLAGVFTSSGGDLKQVALALVNIPEGWSAPLAKLRTPYEMSIATYRALGKRYTDDNSWVFSEPLYALRQMAWEAPSPKGYSDDTPTWLNPDALRIRLDVAQLSSWEFAPDYAHSVRNLALSLFDSAVTADTKNRINAAASANDALTILLSCPEFQRR